jgi:hypothetical protein
MTDELNHGVVSTMLEINRAWLEGRVDDLAGFVHPEIVMVLPGFCGRIRGSADFVGVLRKRDDPRVRGT